MAGIADPVPPDAQHVLIRLEKEQYGPSTQITGLAPFTTELSHMGIQGPIKESFSSEVSKENLYIWPTGIEFGSQKPLFPILVLISDLWAGTPDR